MRIKELKAKLEAEIKRNSENWEHNWGWSQEEFEAVQETLQHVIDDYLS